MALFTSGGDGDVYANLLAIKDVDNIEKIKNLLYFASNSERKEEVLSRVSELVKRVTVLIGIFGQLKL